MGYRAFFHPLDAIDGWNRAYDPRGFLQYQFVVPEEAGTSAITGVLSVLRRNGIPVYLAVLKRFGSIASNGWMSFPMPGWTLALDIPLQSKNEIAVLSTECDSIVASHGGRLYPAKDASMLPATFQRMFPRWQDVQAVKDPAVTSVFWQRVTQQS